MSESTTAFPWNTPKPKQSKLKTYGRSANKTSLRETTSSIFTTHQQEDARRPRRSPSPLMIETPHKKPKTEPFTLVSSLSANQPLRFATNHYPNPSKFRSDKSNILQATQRHNSGSTYANMAMKIQTAEKDTTQQHVLPPPRKIQMEIAAARQRRLDNAITENDRAEKEYQRKRLKLYEFLWKAQIAHAPVRGVTTRDKSGGTFTLTRSSKAINARATLIEKDIKNLNEKRMGKWWEFYSCIEGLSMSEKNAMRGLKKKELEKPNYVPGWANRTVEIKRSVPAGCIYCDDDDCPGCPGT